MYRRGDDGQYLVPGIQDMQNSPRRTPNSEMIFIGTPKACPNVISIYTSQSSFLVFKIGTLVVWPIVVNLSAKRHNTLPINTTTPTVPVSTWNPADFLPINMQVEKWNDRSKYNNSTPSIWYFALMMSVYFLINKDLENVEIREFETIQIPFWTYGNVLFRTCYHMYSYLKFKHSNIQTFIFH